jgi:hypothetical protein
MDADNSKKRLAARDRADFAPVFGAELPTIIGSRPSVPDNSKKRRGAEPPGVTTRPFGTINSSPD